MCLTVGNGKKYKRNKKEQGEEKVRHTKDLPGCQISLGTTTSSKWGETITCSPRAKKGKVFKKVVMVDKRAFGKGKCPRNGKRTVCGTRRCGYNRNEVRGAL